MKKLIISLLMFFMFLNLNAQEPQIKFYLNDGTERTYLISDVEEMSFIESEKGSLLTVFQTPQESPKYFLTNDISYIYVNNEEMSIVTDSEVQKYQLWTIDSLTVKAIEFEKVIIGNQVWMKRNLDVTHYRNGDAIQEVIDPEKWEPLREGAWCYYDNDPENGKIYGKLYNWYAVNDERGLAPEGWRVANEEDWIELEMTLGMTSEQVESWHRRGTAEGTMLAGGYDLWRNGDLRNHNDFNSSGYLGIPGGYRWIDGSFGFILNTTGWWSSTADSIESAKNRSLGFGFTSIFRHNFIKHIGFSVRCIRDE